MFNAPLPFAAFGLSASDTAPPAAVDTLGGDPLRFRRAADWAARNNTDLPVLEARRVERRAAARARLDARRRRVA